MGGEGEGGREDGRDLGTEERPITSEGGEAGSDEGDFSEALSKPMFDIRSWRPSVSYGERSIVFILFPSCIT